MKKGLTMTKIIKYLDDNNIMTCEEVLNNIPNIFNYIMLDASELGISQLKFNEFETIVKSSYQRKVMEDQFNKHFKGVFNGSN